MAISAVTFTAGGRTHKLRLTARAGCELEERFDAPITEIFGEVQANFGYRFLRDVYKACLHDGEGASEDEAEAVIDGLGGLKGATDKLNAMIAKAFPDEVKEAEGQGNGKGKAA